MVSHAGIVMLDQEIPSPAYVCRLEQILKARSPDSELLRFIGGVAFILEGDEQILEGESWFYSGKEIVVWDGRLDNSEEVQRSLSCLGARETKTAELVARSYSERGIDFIEYIVGDFAFCLWDAKIGGFQMGRDPFGTRPLFYVHEGNQVIWASSLQTLLALVAGSVRLDDRYVAAYLTTNEDNEQTPYESIKSVPPGSIISFDKRGSVARSFWKPRPKRIIEYTHDNEYEEEFLGLFQRSVAARLRTEQTVFAELSGGLDSSSIVCIGDDLLKSGRATARGLETVSYVYGDSATSDETMFIGVVENFRGKRGWHLSDSRILAPTLEEALRVDLPTPLLIYPDTFNELSAVMRGRQSHLLLSGMGGDQVLVNDVSSYHFLADLAVKRNFKDLLRLARASSHSDKRNYLGIMVSGIVSPLLPTRLRSLWASDGFRVPQWLNRTFARRTDYAERLLGNPSVNDLTNHHSRQQCSMILQAISVAAAGYYRNWCDIDVMYPFLDRPLVEFLLSIPPGQLIRPGESRSIQRRSFRGLLPEKIRSRRSKRGPDEALCRALNREWGRISQVTRNPAIGEHGYVDAKRFEDALIRARHGMMDGLQPLMRALALEFWLRSRELPDCSSWGISQKREDGSDVSSLNQGKLRERTSVSERSYFGSEESRSERG